MSLETGVYLADLNAANPPGADPKSQGDDHLRLIKTVVKNSFPGFPGIVLSTGTEVGSGDAYAVALSPAPGAYTAAMLVVFKATHANAGAATLNLNGLGAKALKAVDGSALEAGDIESGGVVGAFYDGTDFFLISANDRAARAGDSYTGTHDFTAATAITVPTQAAGNATTRAATTAFVDASFAKIAGQAYSGAQNFTGATITAPTQSPGDNSTKVATTAFATQLAFQTALPVQTGQAGKVITTDGTSASWQLAVASHSGNGGKFLTTDGTTTSWANILNLSAAKSANYTVVAGDRYKAFDLTGSATLSLLAAATAGDGFIFYVRNGGTGVWTIDPNGSETIDARSAILVYPSESFALICAASNWRTYGRKNRALASSLDISGLPAAQFESIFSDLELATIEFEFENIVSPSVSSLYTRFKASGSYIAASYNTAFVQQGSAGSASGASIVGPTLTTAPAPFSGKATLFSPLSPTAAVPTLYLQGGNTGYGIFHGIGGNTTSINLQGVQFFMPSGSNFTSGTIRCYIIRE